MSRFQVVALASAAWLDPSVSAKTILNQLPAGSLTVEKVS
jgi:hypothetical protein